MIIAVLFALAALLCFGASALYNLAGFRPAAVLFLVAGWVCLASEILTIWG